MKRIALAAIALVIGACSAEEDPVVMQDAPDAETPSPEAAPESGQTGLSTSAAVTAEDIAARIEILASDAFEGRAPGTPGGEQASQWIADEMQRIGLSPLPNGTYFQSVPLVESTLDIAESDFSVSGPDGDIPLAYGDDAVYWTKRLENQLRFEDSELVFIGYGAIAPEYGWNDYAGIEDWSGKTVVMLVNDPGFATEDPDLFNGRAMTYYGRWTYKFEEAGRQGPDAAIIIHETEPASYGWAVVRNSWSGPQLALESDAPRAMMEGWISREAADRLFGAAGLDLDALKEAAKQPGFEPVAMDGLTAAATIATDISRSESRNVGGILPGSERPEEYVLYTAHWDHLGMAPEGFNEDRIYNGAVDNGTGVAGILDVAEAMIASGEPERSVLFLTVTAEESGLIGSDYFAANPIVPLRQIVAGINIDAILPAGEAHNWVVVGYGSSELDDILADILEERGKRVTPDPNPEAGYFYRSDHVSLAKRGVPMLYASGGEDLIEGGVEAGREAEAEWRANRYHKVTDEFDPESWDLQGLANDFGVYLELGERLANSEDWPNWYEGTEFRALRDAQRAGAD